MKKQFLILLFIPFNIFKCFSQVDTGDIVYEPVTEDLFKSYKNAPLIVDYYFTDGISLGDRYSYEIIIVDSLLMVAFTSPETDTYKKVYFENKTLLDQKQVDSLKSILKLANLKQTKNGIPRATFSAHTKEALIIKYQNISIAGGLAYSNIASYPDTETPIQVKQEIERDRKSSSSIGGNYDLVITTVKKYFTNLSKLKAKAIRKE
jgi:hypothetical protein